MNRAKKYIDQLNRFCKEDLIVILFAESVEDLNRHTYSEKFIDVITYLYLCVERPTDFKYDKKHENLYLRGREYFMADYFMRYKPQLIDLNKRKELFDYRDTGSSFGGVRYFFTINERFCITLDMKMNGNISINYDY